MSHVNIFRFTGGQDYVVNNTIVFPAMSPSNSQECVMVEIVDDQLFEDVYELFDISLDNISISEVVVATPTQQQVTIVDNDSELTPRQYKIWTNFSYFFKSNL